MERISWTVEARHGPYTDEQWAKFLGQAARITAVSAEGVFTVNATLRSYQLHSGGKSVTLSLDVPSGQVDAVRNKAFDTFDLHA